MPKPTKRPSQMKKATEVSLGSSYSTMISFVYEWGAIPSGSNPSDRMTIKHSFWALEPVPHARGQLVAPVLDAAACFALKRLCLNWVNISLLSVLSILSESVNEKVG